MVRLLLCFLIFFSFSCGKIPQEEEESLSFPASTAENYFRNVSTVNVHVYYEPGAEPFVGNQINGNSLWQILDKNLEEVFKFRSAPPSRNVPRLLDSMTSLPTQGKSTWSAQQVYDLYTQHNQGQGDTNQARFYVYFVNGYAEQGTSIIGFNISNTPIIVIFKDVVRATGGNNVQKYVEQSTLVHEMGHALGLVNNGVPITSAHHDIDHGAHTTDSDCVMYYLNEGASDMASFVGKFIIGGDISMWGPQVMSDVQSFSR